MGTRTRRNPEESKRIILDATEYYVRKNGPDGFRLADVAKRAGMHQSNILHHFGSREALLNEMAHAAFERGAKRAIQAFGEAFSAPQDQRVESLSKVFDAVHQEDTGGLYAGLLLSGRMSAADAPNFEPLVQTVRNWRRAMLDDKHTDEDEEQMYMMTLLSLIVWLGESVAGEFFAHALQLEDPEQAQHKMRRTFSEMIVGLMTGKST